MSNSSEDYRCSHLNKGNNYDDALKLYHFDVYMALMEERWLKDIISKYFSDKIDSYLDFACGTGRIISSIEQFATYSCGIDISESMLQSARSKSSKSVFFCLDLTKE